jgi:hypothetical protein
VTPSDQGREPSRSLIPGEQLMLLEVLSLEKRKFRKD